MSKVIPEKTPGRTAFFSIVLDMKLKFQMNGKLKIEILF